jgi:hypothetical protein
VLCLAGKACLKLLSLIDIMSGFEQALKAKQEVESMHSELQSLMAWSKKQKQRDKAIEVCSSNIKTYSKDFLHYNRFSLPQACLAFHICVLN